MALPKLEVPTFEIELPLSKKKIKYRPFLVKEQKALLMAMESGEAATIQHNVREIINSCTLSEDFNIDRLPIIDVEYYFINLRVRSVSEIAESRYRCNNVVEDKECGNTMDVKVDLTNIQPVTDVVVDPEIHLTDTIIVKMKYPEFLLVKDSINIDSITDVTFNMVASSIEYIYDGEQFYYSHEVPHEEMVEFIERLNQEQFDKLENFFNNMPKLKQHVAMKCSKCGFDHSFDVEGLENFFG